MSKLAIVTALESEVGELTKNYRRIERGYDGRKFTFFEHGDAVLVCGGIGLEAARRAAEAVIASYRPTLVQSVGFAGALDASMHVGDIISPAVVLDARDGSSVEIVGGEGTLVTFMTVAGAEQKQKLAQAYRARAVDMEAAAVAAAAAAHGIRFTATKVISDGLPFEMPETARFIDSRGGFRTPAFAAFVALAPWLWRRVTLLASNTNHADAALAQHLKAFRRPLYDAVEAKTT